MIKEFKIKEILNAVNNISKIEEKKIKIEEKKHLSIADDVFDVSKQAKLNKDEVLVLNKIIE